jgi:hypothetical protein
MPLLTELIKYDEMLDSPFKRLILSWKMPSVKGLRILKMLSISIITGEPRKRN